ncbi:2-C-methyl-D-erythritol 4-phosphate cytidylyltransferase [Gracilibacillus sp. YIM 98692]|uniref:2-C-methyl-D-erythritol 4-phosphate cytidylyltransferase n=1 Tax=Gracilibacillus sp. YIM 98692 TaxID=2663532 RepID=UPI0013D0FD01|nr:2-C-methyl-D-erythritol 4-phosphate cytidylyltransferase [Gracilibacillus sp. YIM 98692]
MKYNVIVLAAGQGKRMNFGKNKQFIPLQEEPLIVHTIKNFVKDPWCQKIYLVINPIDRIEMKKLFQSYDWSHRLQLVDGGNERQESGYKGILAIKEEDDEFVVMIHDGARPFVSTKLLHELAHTASHSKAALLAVPVTDTIKQKTGGSIQTLDRSTLWAAQTPQAFQYRVIKQAHQKALEEQYIGTDDASLVEALGETVKIVQGSYENVKLTTPEDIARAETILQEKGEE